MRRAPSREAVAYIARQTARQQLRRPGKNGKRGPRAHQSTRRVWLIR